MKGAHNMEPPSPEWSIESELIRLSGGASWSDALRKLRFDEFGRLQPYEVRGWHRSGAESYLYLFDLRLDGVARYHLALKACAPSFSVATTIEETLERWTMRRLHLAGQGVQTPQLHHSGAGVILEEFIPYSITDLVGTRGYRLDVLESVARYCAVLEKEGFNVVAPFHDLMSRGSDAVVVDFGSDLGDAKAIEPSTRSYYHELLAWLRQQGILLREDEIDKLESAFLKS